MGFPGIVKIWVLDSYNINIVWTIFQWIDVFASLPSFTLTFELVFVIVLSLLHWPLPVQIIIYALPEILTLCVCFNRLF